MEINVHENLPAVSQKLTNVHENLPAQFGSVHENLPAHGDRAAALWDELLALREARDSFRSRVADCTRLIRALEKQIKRATRRK